MKKRLGALRRVFFAKMCRNGTLFMVYNASTTYQGRRNAPKEKEIVSWH